MGLIEQLTGGIIPQPSPDGSHAEEREVKEIALGLFDRIEDALNRLEFHRALGEIWTLVDRTNRYIEQMAPWKLAKRSSDQKKLETVLYTAAESLRFIALYLFPFMPSTSMEMARSLGLSTAFQDL
ncbi:MAG: class I tRNA ligase family protein, partial [Nitrospiria bacterium]